MKIYRTGFQMLACACMVFVFAACSEVFGQNEKPDAVKVEVKTGLIKDFHIDTKLFSNSKDYFKDPIQQKVYKAFKDGKIPESWKENNKIAPDECVGFKPGEFTALIYVPEDYYGKQPYGIYMHISPMQNGINPGQYRELMKKMKMIYVSGNDAGNDISLLRRIAISMDAMASVMAHYNIDRKRVVSGGTSGGGHVGMFCQMMYPQYFQGAISHAAQSYLPGRKGDYGHFPGLELSDAKKAPRMDNRWVVISGDKDQNYKTIIETSKDWDKEKFRYLFIDVPGMTHDNASPEKLEEALNWIFEGYKNSKGFKKK